MPVALALHSGHSMKRLLTIVGISALFVALAVGGRWLWIALHVGAGYAAKVTCSLALNSAQDPTAIHREYVSHEITPLGPLLRVSVSDGGARATLFGIEIAHAVYRRGRGCTLLFDDGELGSRDEETHRMVLPSAIDWPEVDAADATDAIAAAIDEAFREPEPLDPGRLRQTKAVVVIHDGRLLAERYAPGYGPQTPMLSWSMAKSLLAALVGVAVGNGRLALHQPVAIDEWSSPGDPRHSITLDQLLRMSSGLAFDEHYGAINDVSRMLFTMPDTGAFAARSPLAAPPDTRWAYSSGTSNLVARLLRNAFNGDPAALARYAKERLFDPVGMTSAFFEVDASGTFIGSSFAFMTARDWARLGELHRRDGIWNGRRILPEGWVKYVTTPTPAAPQGRYGAHWWLNAGDPNDPSKRMWPQVPRDAYAARGHSGQYVVVVPSAKLVVVRLGLSIPDDGVDGAADLVDALVRSTADLNRN